MTIENKSKILEAVLELAPDKKAHPHQGKLAAMAALFR